VRSQGFNTYDFRSHGDQVITVDYGRRRCSDLFLCPWRSGPSTFRRQRRGTVSARRGQEPASAGYHDLKSANDVVQARLRTGDTEQDLIMYSPGSGKSRCRAFEPDDKELQRLLLGNSGDIGGFDLANPDDKSVVRLPSRRGRWASCFYRASGDVMDPAVLRNGLVTCREWKRSVTGAGYDFWNRRIRC